jgi:hypothetical protein
MVRDPLTFLARDRCRGSGGQCGASSSGWEGGCVAVFIVRACFILSLAAAAGIESSVLAQTGSVDPDTVTVLKTGNGQPLATFSQILSAGSLGQTPILRFSFGFSTAEAISPNAFLDSVSLTVQNGSSQSAIFFTADASGVQWAPVTPGNVLLNAANWNVTPITFPGLQPDYPTEFAYSVTAALPSAFQGQELNFYFDLFDNQNPQGSLAWITPITVVPEPGIWSFGLFPLLVFVFFRRSRL